MSVDGVNIVSGETANYDQRGYIFDAHESHAVNGWRKSDTEIAAFTFASLPQSYAARTGRPADVGVIGMAVFNERPAVQEPTMSRTWPPTTPTPRGFSEASARSRAESRRVYGAAASPGTGRAVGQGGSLWVVFRRRHRGAARRQARHGARRARTVGDHRGGVRRGDGLSAISSARSNYDSYDNLVASGVIQPAWNTQHRPRPFHASRRGRFRPRPAGPAGKAFAVRPCGG